MKENKMDKLKFLGMERVGRALKKADETWDGVQPFNTKISPAIDYLYTWDKLNLPENADIKAQIVMEFGFGILTEIEKKALRSREARGL
ncbi:hypothetical protein LCGC14_0396660 [marine sediment metagenome]|uniref:Uncharacterized protein n=1 Tax=marine sediment metagenome TaxID=412755 RepID=A0A0F9T3X7_9ZZZZ